MRRKTIYSIACIAIIALSTTVFVLYRSEAVGTRFIASSSIRSLQPEGAEYLVAAPGRVEPVSEEIEVGAEISGKIKAVMVEEGDRVRRGQTIAILENNDYRAQLASAEARIAQAEAELRRVINGARSQERHEALATVEQVEAVVRNAEIEFERRRSLFRDGVIAREELDRAERDLGVARARYKGARERYGLVDADAREEDRARAEAAVSLARAQRSEARARLEKTFIRSPITGIALRRRLNAGESVSIELPNSSIFTIANTDTLLVRVDIDETDVDKVKLGQRAYVRADAYGDKKFLGRVVRISQVLGPKKVYTEEPVERIDRKILETLVELDGGQILRLGLRVDAFIIADNSSPNP